MASDPDAAKAHEKATQIAGVMGLFDFVIESSKVGLRKPNPRIYELACEKNGHRALRGCFSR